MRHFAGCPLCYIGRPTFRFTRLRSAAKRSEAEPSEANQVQAGVIERRSPPRFAIHLSRKKVMTKGAAAAPKPKRETAIPVADLAKVWLPPGTDPARQGYPALS